MKILKEKKFICCLSEKVRKKKFLLASFCTRVCAWCTTRISHAEPKDNLKDIYFFLLFTGVLLIGE